MKQEFLLRYHHPICLDGPNIMIGNSLTLQSIKSILFEAQNTDAITSPTDETDLTFIGAETSGLCAPF